MHSFKREFSSAGSEHLPYKQRVGGSNPSTPTNLSKTLRFFYAPYLYSVLFSLMLKKLWTPPSMFFLHFLLLVQKKVAKKSTVRPIAPRGRTGLRTITSSNEQELFLVRKVVSSAQEAKKISSKKCKWGEAPLLN